MESEHAPLAERLFMQLADFMEEFIYPAELRYERESQGAERWQPRGVVEELKVRAKAVGLWNLFLTDSEQGADLSTVEYARLCELMGRGGPGGRGFHWLAPGPRQTG